MSLLQLTKQHLCHSDEGRISALFYFAIKSKISQIQTIEINERLKLTLEKFPSSGGVAKIRKNF